MAFTTSDNNYGPTKYIVNPVAGLGTHTTIAAAVTAASSTNGDIVIYPGTYTENVTGFNGLRLIGMETVGVIIKGKISMAVAGTVTLENLTTNTNGDYSISLTGTSAAGIRVKNCIITPNDHAAILCSNSNAGSGIEVYDCSGSPVVGFGFFDMSNSSIFLGNCYFDVGSDAVSSTASTVSGGFLYARHSRFNSPITTSSTGALQMNHCIVDCGASNATAVTAGGSGSHTSYNNIFLSGSASAISVGNNLTSVNDTVNSSNTNAVTGAGSLARSNMTFTGSSSLVNTTTVTNVPSTGAATALTSFTPTITGSTGNPTPTYVTQLGRYTRDGNLIFFNINLIVSALTGGTGNFQINGLPFTSNSTANNFTNVVGVVYDGTNVVRCVGQIPNNSTFISFFVGDVLAAYKQLPFTTFIQAQFSGCYSI